MERTRRLKVGNGMEPGIEIGPCVDQAQMETVLGYIESVLPLKQHGKSLSHHSHTLTPKKKNSRSRELALRR